MNRARKVARKWLEQRDHATHVGNRRRIATNNKRRPWCSLCGTWGHKPASCPHNPEPRI